MFIHNVVAVLGRNFRCNYFLSIVARDYSVDAEQLHVVEGQCACLIKTHRFDLTGYNSFLRLCPIDL